MTGNKSRRETLKNEIDRSRQALPMYENIPEGKLATDILTSNISIANRMLKSGTNDDIDRYVNHLRYINAKVL